jgi:ankyrin repeat protein
LFARLAEILRNVDPGAELFSAVEEGDLAKVNKLIDRGASLQAVNKFGQTPLHVAVHTSKLDVVRALLSKGGLSQLEVLDRNGHTAIHAINFENTIVGCPDVTAMVEFLLAAGADANATVRGKGAVLHRAADNCQLGAIDLLLCHGADLEARKDPGQKTPLHIACCALEDAHASVVKQLLGAGANPRAEASWGTLPLSIAYDAVVRETRLLCDQKPTEGHRTSTLYPICCRFRAAIDIMVELLKYLNPADIKDEAHRHQIKETFIFRNIDDPENTRICKRSSRNSVSSRC